MTVVKINAIEVPDGQGEALEQRFRSRAGEVEHMPGFLSFELLRPTNGETRYFVYTRWESEDAFQAWITSDAFTRGHATPPNPATGPVATRSHLLEFEVALSTQATTNHPPTSHTPDPQNKQQPQQP